MNRPCRRVTHRVSFFFVLGFLINLTFVKALPLKPILSLQQITKHYGRIRALDQVSFEVPEGSVFGILGPNGSGKTTLLGVIMDVLKADHGQYSWFGQPPSEEQRRQIGTLLETPNFYHYLSGEKNLQVAAAIKQRSRDDIPRVLDLVRLTERRQSRFNTYSLGMKQRLAIASCLLGNPAVLVFDEPTNGLDPAGIAEIRQLIRQLAREGKTIILASHLLDEVEKVCTHVAILQKGQLITAGQVNEVLVNEEMAEVGAADLASLKSLLLNWHGVKQVRESDTRLQVFFENGDIDLSSMNQYCFNHGIVLNHLQWRKRSLESKFIELTGNTSN